jgi:hypothetical protein
MDRRYYNDHHTDLAVTKRLGHDSPIVGIEQSLIHRRTDDAQVKWTVAVVVVRSCHCRARSAEDTFVGSIAIR